MRSCAMSMRSTPIDRILHALKGCGVPVNMTAAAVPQIAGDVLSIRQEGNDICIPLGDAARWAQVRIEGDTRRFSLPEATHQEICQLAAAWAAYWRL